MLFKWSKISISFKSSILFKTICSAMLPLLKEHMSLYLITHNHCRSAIAVQYIHFFLLLWAPKEVKLVNNWIVHFPETGRKTFSQYNASQADAGLWSGLLTVIISTFPNELIVLFRFSFKAREIENTSASKKKTTHWLSSVSIFVHLCSGNLPGVRYHEWAILPAHHEMGQWRGRGESRRSGDLGIR